MENTEALKLKANIDSWKEELEDDSELPPEDLESDEPQFETYQHLQQIMLLIKCLDRWWKDRTDFFATSNLSIYYCKNQPSSKDVPGPDFFVVLNTQPKPRNSWIVLYEDGKYPDVIIEIISEITENIDKGFKKKLYQDTFRTPNYFWFDPFSLEFKGFTLVSGVYEPLEPNAQGLLWSQQLNLYLGIHQDMLRYFTPDGQLVPTPEEAANLAKQRADQAEQERQRVEKQLEDRRTIERLRAKLRELGIDPDTL